MLGTTLVTVGLTAIVLPLIEGRQHGWPAWTWLSLVAGYAPRYSARVTTFGTAVDITVSELSIEAFFPADASTAEALSALAAAAA